MYTFVYDSVLDLSGEGGPKLYKIEDTDTGQFYWVDFALVASSAEAVEYVRNYGIVRRGTITGATKTKITYDAYGIVTAGANATTADIADSSNKRYVTDAQLTVIGNTSGTNTGDQDLSSYALTANVVPNTRTVNGNALSSNVTITLASLGGAASGANTDITSVLLNQTGLVIKGGDANALTIKPNETLTAGRTLNVITGDASRTLTLSADATIGGTHSGTSSGTNTGDQTLGSLGAAASGSNSDITALNNVLTLVKVVQSGLKLQDTATKLLTIKNDNTLGANRTLNIQVADADRTIALSGDLTVSSAATISGTNTGDQTITLTGDVTGTGTGSFAATIANGAVTEAKMTLADNTTNDVSISKHGFMVKAPNDNTKVWKGDAVYGKGWNVVTKNSDQSVTNSSTLTDDTALTFAMAASTKYIVRIKIYWSLSNNTSQNFKYALSAPASPTKVMIRTSWVSPAAQTTWNVAMDSSVTGSTTITVGSTPTNPGFLEFDVMIQNGSNAGTFKFQFAQGTQTSSNSATVYAGSFLEWTTAA